MTKKQLTWVFIGVALILAGSAVWWFFLREDECDPEKNGFTKKGKPSDKCKKTNPSLTNTPPPAGTQWTPDTTFPLKKGSWGSRVAAVQKAVGFSSAQQDGRFGAMTESAVQAKIGKPEVSQPDYEKLINPPTTGGGSNFSQLKEALKNRSQNFPGGIKTIEQGQNQNYQFEFYASNGRVFIYNTAKNEIRRGTYYNGGKKIVIDSPNDEESSESTVQQVLKDIVTQIEG